jgi:hypothetical protein
MHALWTTVGGKHIGSLAVAAVCVAVLCGQVADGADVRVTNVAGAADGRVQFDITWTHSWRASWKEGDATWTNWDAAWIFVKYRTKGDPGWSHASLSPKDADHAAPKGAVINVGRNKTRGMGVFLYRAAEGKGAWTNKGVTLKWLHKEDKVADPAKVELSVHALEMVYVPEGAFYVGSAGRIAGSFVDGSWKPGKEIIPFKVTGEEELKVLPEPGCLYGTAVGGFAHTIGPKGALTAAFPKGYGAFYCMKYELSEGEYAAFLDQLAPAQAAARYPRACFLPKHKQQKLTQTHTVTKGPKGYTSAAPERSCNWLDWDDGEAYADWAGLRLMTELEYEKACRGPLKPVPSEYAWGTGTIVESQIPALDKLPPPPYPVGICGAEGRVKLACTYWGIAAMSGHLRERTVAVGHERGRLYTGLCGDGALKDDGFANVPGWPGPISAWKPSQISGGGFRGGPWYGTALVDRSLMISNRYLAACQRRQRHTTYGWRGVRQAP